MNRAGFTLVELLIVFSISMMLFGIIGNFASNTYPKNQLRSETQTVVQTIRQAQVLTIARKNDTVWGVHVEGATLTLFGGSSYETRDESLDRTHVFPSGVIVSGLTDVVFIPLKGTTEQTGQITLSSQATAESFSLTINENGVVSF